jgi:hypothetical protein
MDEFDAEAATEEDEFLKEDKNSGEEDDTDYGD